MLTGATLRFNNFIPIREKLDFSKADRTAINTYVNGITLAVELCSESFRELAISTLENSYCIKSQSTNQSREQITAQG